MRDVMLSLSKINNSIISFIYLWENHKKQSANLDKQFTIIQNKIYKNLWKYKN